MSGDVGIAKSSEAESGPPGHTVPLNGPRSVFLSYASHDAGTANSVCQFLERNGLSCWLAPRDVKPGTPYAAAIVNAINEANTLVVVLSASSIQSDHVAREIERAGSKHKQIIAFRIDAAPLSAELEYFLSKSQWIDVPALGMPGALAKLAGAVGSAAVNASGPDVPVKPKKKSRVGLVAGAFALVVAGGLAVYFWSSSHRAMQPAAEVVVTDKSIAVLPFVDMSEKKDQEYFADGMAEEILDLLTKIPELTVIGRTSSFQFKGKNEDLRTIGAKLNAAYVLEGSVRKAGDQVRVTAQLINTRTGAHEWSETYDRPFGDVLKLQDAIAAAVARELQLTVAPEESNLHPIVKSTEAYDLYLRGRHAADRVDKKGFDEAVMLFQRALDRDPTFVDAAVALSWVYSNQVAVGSLAPAIGFEQSLRAATNALKLDPNNARAHVSVAWIHLVYDWDWASAERELKRAANLAPGDVYVLTGQAALSSTLGHWDDALRQTNAAVAQDPLDPDLLQSLSDIHESRGDLQEADAVMRRVLEIRPNYAYGHYNLGVLYLKRGDRDAALREMQQETVEDGRQQGLALAYYALDRKADADSALAILIKEQAEGSALDIAEVYAFRGQSDEAMHWLERAYAQKDPWLFKIKGDWFMKSLKSDPRFKAFLKKMNLPE